MPVLALIGAQWGSEGKGVIAQKLASRFDVAVRVGGPNAGHSLYHERRLYKMRSIPCAWVNPNADLFIGAGGVVNPHVLMDELEELPSNVGVTIDPLAVLVTPEDEAAELASIRQTIGSTAEGVGEARVARIRRRGYKLAGDWPWPKSRVRVHQVAPVVEAIAQNGGWVMLEGTQGSGLSLLHGTQYPYVTSSDTNASGLASEVGLAPSAIDHVHLVARTYPIRVAGNSGPMGVELDWQDFIDRGVVEKPEQTTVTRKTRRISEWDEDVFEAAVRLNRPCGVWLTFGDYLDPSIRGSEVLSDLVMHYADSITRRHGVPVLGVGTGPKKDAAGNVYDWELARHEMECRHGVMW